MTLDEMLVDEMPKYLCMLDSVVGTLSTAELVPLTLTNHTIYKMTLDEMLGAEMPRYLWMMNSVVRQLNLYHSHSPITPQTK
jgi:hypothetical protein